MGFELRMPNIKGATDAEQIAQIKSYLYQIVEQLQFIIDTLDNQSKGGTK